MVIYCKNAMLSNYINVYIIKKLKVHLDINISIIYAYINNILYPLKDYVSLHHNITHKRKYINVSTNFLTYNLFLYNVKQ